MLMVGHDNLTLRIQICVYLAEHLLPMLAMPANHLRQYRYVARLCKGVNDYLPSARITFENFCGIAQAWTNIDKMRVPRGVVKASG